MKTTQLVGSRIKAEFNKRYPCLPPVGSVIGWQKNLLANPVLPPNWLECNGQVVFDTESPFFNQALPILNSNSRVLKGGLISGLLETIGLKSANSPDVQINTSSIVWIIRIK